MLISCSKKMATKGDDHSFLPLEIIINILERLPIKSIVRFQSVCKEWKNLFKTQTFITQHFHHSDHKNPFLLLHENNCNNGSTSLRLLNQNMETVQVLGIPSNNGFQHGWKIIGSCNGLLCVIVNLYVSISPQSLCLWNPAIRKVKQIPQTTNDYWGLCVFGFGFSSMVNDYKIVKFYNQEMHKKEEEDQNHHIESHLHDGVEVYSVGTGLWKELEFGALQGITVTSTSVSSDGIIVWLGKQDSIYVLISFDIVTEVFTVISIPSVGGVFPTGLGVWGDKFVVFWRNSGSNSIDIRVMEQFVSESGKSLICTEIYRASTSFHPPDPICVWRNVMVFSGIESEDEGGGGGDGDDNNDHDDDEDEDRDDGDEDEDEDGDDDDEEEEDGEAKLFIKMFNLTNRKWENFPNFSSPHDWIAGFNYERSLVSVSICNT